jgi:hypothetical protein
VSNIDSRERLVLVATGFNLLFEHSLCGINGFLLQSLLLPILFIAYAKCFTIRAARGTGLLSAWRWAMMLASNRFVIAVFQVSGVVTTRQA